VGEGGSDSSWEKSRREEKRTRWAWEAEGKADGERQKRRDSAGRDRGAPFASSTSERSPARNGELVSPASARNSQAGLAPGEGPFASAPAASSLFFPRLSSPAWTARATIRSCP